MINRLKTWWNKQIVARVKHVALSVFILVLLFASFQYQVSAQSAAREHAVCVSRVEGRDDLRAVLFYVVDLSDVIPNGKAASYTANRVDYINRAYPSLDSADC